MLIKKNIFSSSPSFEVFAETKQLLNYVTFLQSFPNSKIKKIVDVIFLSHLFLVFTSVDLITLPLRYALKLRSEDHFVKNLFLKVMKYSWGFYDRRELDYKSLPLTNHLLEKADQLSENSKLKKYLLTITLVVATHLTMMVDMLLYPLRSRNHLKVINKNREKTVLVAKVFATTLFFGAGYLWHKSYGRPNSLSNDLGKNHYIDKLERLISESSAKALSEKFFEITVAVRNKVDNLSSMAESFKTNTLFWNSQHENGVENLRKIREMNTIDSSFSLESFLLTSIAIVAVSFMLIEVRADSGADQYIPPAGILSLIRGRYVQPRGGELEGERGEELEVANGAGIPPAVQIEGEMEGEIKMEEGIEIPPPAALEQEGEVDRLLAHTRQNGQRCESINPAYIDQFFSEGVVLFGGRARARCPVCSDWVIGADFENLR